MSLTRRSRRERERRRPRATVTSVLGEILMTLGVLVAGFVGWQMFLSDAILGHQQAEAALSYADALGIPGRVAPEEEPLRTDEPPATPRVASGESFAVVYIPSLGAYARTVGEGTQRAVLDSFEQGVAHFPDSAMPGEVGNFAIAGHRQAYGGAMTHLVDLHVGDRIYVQTGTAWYVYEFRNHEYVDATDVDTVDAVPQQPDAAPADRLITLLTCHPAWSTAARVAGYGVFVGWLPADAGTPHEVAVALGSA